MNNAWLVVASLVFSFQAYALNVSSLGVQSRQEMANVSEVPTLAATGTTSYFDTLVGWYGRGAPVKFAQFKGFYTGRCFAVNHPNTAVNSLIGYGTHDANDDAGPAFPNDSGFKMTAIVADGYPADHFDTGDHVAELQKLLSQYWKNLSDLNDNPTLTYSFGETNGKFDEKHEIVSYNGYLIDKWTTLIKQNYGEMGQKNPGDILEMCYYFKRVAD